MWPGPGASIVLVVGAFVAASIARRLDQRRANAAPVPQLREHVGTRVTVGIKLGQTALSVRAFTGTLAAVGRRSRRVRFSDVAPVSGEASDPVTVRELEGEGVLAYRIVWLESQYGRRIELE
jgi:hypothetical protein